MGHMSEALEERVNTRVPRRVKEDLSDLAKRRRIDESELARTLLDEAIRRERHPGITFRDTTAGREAAIEGRRLYVWQVMETVWNSDGNASDAAEYLGIQPTQVNTAVDYYNDYRSEIDEIIQANSDEAARLDDLFRLRETAKHR